MFTSTHERTIKVYTIVLDDNEIERFLDDGDALTDLLRDLLIAKPDPNGDGGKRSGGKRSGGKRSGGKHLPKDDTTRVECEWCGQSFLRRGLKLHQHTCPARPA